MKLLLLFFLAFILGLAFPTLSLAQAPNLGTASSFALFTANGALTNSGASMITGNIGTNVGAISGFGTATIIGSTRTAGSSESIQAATDVTDAYNSLSTPTCGTLIATELGGQTLTPGVSCQNTATATSLNGTLTLSGPGIFIIKLNSALTTATNSTILLTNGATANNVFFQINGAATLGTGSAFQGTILAKDAIVLNTQASLVGRALSTAGAITLNNNAVTNVAAPLPVTLISFTAKVQENHTVVVAWTTSLETSNKGFLVERSKDFHVFETVSEVNELASTSETLKNYKLTDQTPYSGTSYYRLTQIDLGGKTATYPAISVILRDGAYGVFPNPVVSDTPFTLRLDEPETAIVSFYSVDGRSVPVQKMGIQSGNLLLKTTSNLGVGLYVLTVEERGQKRQHRFVVQ